MDGQTERRIKDFLEKIPSGVKVVAATKCRSIELVSECPAHGIFAAGENRVQELLSKYQPVEGLEWHFIGQLQTNKVKYILDKVSLIQSLDRVSLADKLEEECGKTRLDYARFGRGQTRRRVDARRCQSGRTYGFCRVRKGEKTSDAQRTYDRYAVRQRKKRVSLQKDLQAV